MFSPIIRDLTGNLHHALEVVQPGERVLAIIPDKTRDDNTHLLFPIANEFLAGRGVAAFDVLVAQGTHPPMSDSQKRSKIGTWLEVEIEFETKPEDIDELTFNYTIMVENKLLAKTSQDSREDFKGGYDFQEAFRLPFLPGRPALPAPAVIKADAQ